MFAWWVGISSFKNLSIIASVTLGDSLKLSWVLFIYLESNSNEYIAINLQELCYLNKYHHKVRQKSWYELSLTYYTDQTFIVLK